MHTDPYSLPSAGYDEASERRRIASPPMRRTKASGPETIASTVEAARCADPRSGASRPGPADVQ